MALFVRHKKLGPLKPTPNPYPTRFQRWPSSFWLICLLILMGISGLRFYSPFYDVFEMKLFEGTASLHSIFMSPFQKTKTLLNDTHTFMNLREEFETLKAENEVLKWKLQTLAPLMHENESLRKSLKVPALDVYGHLTARVFSTPYDGLHHSFLISAGKKDGLEKNQAVICPEGVVGRLKKVGDSISRVLLLNDVNSRIPVMLSTSKQKAILAGQGRGFPTLVYVKDIRKIEKGEKVETSGFGGIFPPGLPVGIVEDITNGKVNVRLYTPLQDLEWVHILCSHPEQGDEDIDKDTE